MIHVEDLSVSYGAVKALRNVTMSAPTGRITAVLGTNGAGKTTLLRAISGLVKPSSGTIHCNTTALVGMATDEIARFGVGHVPEGRGVIAEFTIEENLRLGVLASKIDANEGLERQFELFPVLGERRKQYASTLSGGERQMLAMARALIARPSFLLLDEPSLGLAPQVTAEMMRTISSLCTMEDLTVILVEQNAKSALRIAHEAVVLHLGSVIASGTAETVGDDSDLRRYYLGLVQ
ncbi:MAG TPA: ABC transporter ATP-binding protein [Acidimicrobiales bacterium]